MCLYLARGPTATIVLTLTTTQALSAAATGIASGPEYLFLTFLAALVFAAIHLLGRALAFLRPAPRSVWLSAAGGISIAYVFVHILPELAHHQDVFATHAGRLSLLDTSERDVYFAALVGLATFYGLELWARSSARRRARRDGVGRPSSRHVMAGELNRQTTSEAIRALDNDGWRSAYTSSDLAFELVVAPANALI
jgi:hypothetical protein